MPPRRRRSPGEGAVFEYTTKSGAARYGIKFLVPRPDGTKKQVLRRRGPNGETWTTLKAAQAAIRKAMAEVDRDQWFEPSKQPLSSYLEQWLDGLRLAPSTVASYRRNIRLHLTPRLGGIPLAQLTGPRITSAYRELEESGLRRGLQAGTPLAPRTVRYLHTILRSALAAAVAADLLSRNPADKASPPSAKEARAPEMGVWSASQLSDFLRWAQKHRSELHPAWLTLAHTGVRRGELLALRWRDIDLDAAWMAVRRSVGLVHNLGGRKELVEGPTKGARPRVVDLDEDTVDVLRVMRRQRGAAVLAYVRPDARVFSDHLGNTRHPDRLSEAFVAAVAGCRQDVDELPTIRLHDLRHTHATLLLQAGVPVKVVSERLGHSSPMVTLTTYAHVLPGMQREAATTFAGLVKRPEVSEQYQRPSGWTAATR